MNECPLCNLTLMPNQHVVLANDYCLFLQLEEARQQDIQLAGAGIIVPKIHRETAFDLTKDEWNATYSLLHEAKSYIDEHFSPDGYNIGWNCGEKAGQHIPHAHLHILPRYKDEPLVGKGIRYMFKHEKNIRKP